MGVVLLVVFPFVERRASEPILPLELFRNRIFVVTSAIGFIVGLALFGAITYLPLYLQIVKGHSPTGSGLTLTPLMAGLLVTSILSGQLISRYGRYKPFPIVGTAIMAVALYLLSRLAVDTPTWKTIVVDGDPRPRARHGHAGARPRRPERGRPPAPRGRHVGLDPLPPDRRLDRRRRLRRHLRQPARQRARQQAARGGAHSDAVNPGGVRHLPAAVHEPYVQAFVTALQPVFLAAAGISVLAFLLTWLLREQPLRTTTATSDPSPTRAGDAGALDRPGPMGAG